MRGTCCNEKVQHGVELTWWALSLLDAVNQASVTFELTNQKRRDHSAVSTCVDGLGSLSVTYAQQLSLLSLPCEHSFSWGTLPSHFLPFPAPFLFE